MPVSIEPLDSSIQEENITLILGRNILLKIVEDFEKQALLKNDVVKEFTSIPDLCREDIRSLILELIKTENFLAAPSLARTLTNLSQNEKLDSLMELGKSFETVTGSLTSSHFYKSLEKEIGATAERALKKMSPKDLKNFRSSLMYSIMGKVDRRFVRMQDRKLLLIGNKIKEKTGFDVLVPSNLLFCPKCGVILSTGEYRGTKKCYVCDKEIEQDKAKRIYIHKVHEQVKEVWTKNLWFEAYMARLLRRLDCKTWTSVHVMGASGILHEVDVLAIRNGTVLVCECKTGRVSRNDVFNFCTKVGDLKAHVAILALIQELPETETREFVKKNPAIIRIENMGNKSETKVFEDLRQRLYIKS